MAKRTERRENLATEIICEVKRRLVICRIVLAVSIALNLFQWIFK